jgi:hypothetical protein
VQWSGIKSQICCRAIFVEGIVSQYHFVIEPLDTQFTPTCEVVPADKDSAIRNNRVSTSATAAHAKHKHSHQYHCPWQYPNVVRDITLTVSVIPPTHNSPLLRHSNRM